MDYLDVEQARQKSGLRLVLSAGVPGPWGEAAKGLFHVKGIPFHPVRQSPAVPNPELEAWTGCNNAPVAMYEHERPRSGWVEILHLAERLAPAPRLIPEDPEQRVLMFGLANELCGEMGFGWCRRLALIAGIGAEGALPAAREMAANLDRKYASPGSEKVAAARCAEILKLFAARLLAQREAGSRYLLGPDLTALDIYWATFAALVEPLPQEQCPMSPGFRSVYTIQDSDLRRAVDPILMEHRDFVYREHLGLPLDF
jgi:hypothetical protein